MRALVLAGLAAVMAVAALAMGGPDAYARIALSAGLPQLAARLAASPALEGAAFYLAGDWARAEDALRRAGAMETYNRAKALAQMGDYHASLRAYDSVLERRPDDYRAAEDRAIVATLYDAVEGDILPGDEVAGDGNAEGAPVSPFDKALEAAAAGQRTRMREQIDILRDTALASTRVLREAEDSRDAVDLRWLATFPDAPGDYLRAMIAAEHQRRRRAGLTPPDPVDPR